jgi:hypothetical protein
VKSLGEGKNVGRRSALRGPTKLGLRFVKRDVGKLLRGSQVDDGLLWRMIPPGADGVEIVEQLWRQAGGDGLTAELGRKVVGKVLEHDEADEKGVAGGPGRGIVAKDTEFEGEMFVLNCD